MDDGVKGTLLGVWMALFTIFAARKFTQPIKVNSTTETQVILYERDKCNIKVIIIKIRMSD